VLAGFLCLLLTTPAIAQPNAQKPLLEVLVELNKTKGVYFLFSQQQLGKTLVNIPVLSSNASIERMLTQILRNTGLSFKKIDDRTFVILNKKRIDRDLSPQPVTVTPYPDEDPANPPLEDPAPDVIGGKVTDGEGKVLQGVSVTVKGTRKGTYTDLSGDFSIRAGKDNILVFSFVGFNNKEIPAGLAGKTSVILSPSNQPMTEVLVTALGIGKQEKSLGYSTAELDGSLFTQSREVNLGNALVGQVAGLSVLPNATGPYGSSRVLIRGNASLSGNNQPLYVIDGVPYDNANQAFPGQWGGADLGDGLSNINPDDIESIIVLKGVAASALYGYRGGNGAILVTTKSGSKTKGIGVQVNNNFTVNSVVDQRDYQYSYGQGGMGIKPMSEQAALNAPYFSWGARMDGSAAVNYLGDKYAYSPQRDNFRHFFRTGLTNQSSIALTGANNKGHFRLGVSDLHLSTVIPNSSMAQQGFNFNSTFFITNKLQMELKGDYVFEHVNNRASLSDDPGNVMAAPLYLANTFDIRWMKDHRVHPDGTEWLPGVTDPYFENPYYIAYDYKNKTDRNRLTGGLTLKYNLLDWLYLQGQVTRDGYLFNVSQVTPSGVIYTRSDGVHGGNLTQYTVNFHELNGSFMVGANKKFGESFSFTANIGGNQADNVNEVSGIGAIPNTSNRAAGPFIITGYYDQSNIINKPYTYLYRHYRVNSLFGSADLSWRNFLFLTTTLRNDWFSTLNINTSSYLYPSVSGSFVFSDVFRLPSWFSLGKLRASYAASSNGTSPYQNTLTYGLQGYTVNGQQLGYVATNGLIPDAYLRPVSITEKEVGLYLKFLRDRVGLDLTYYNRQTTNDIVKITVSPTSGYDQDIENVGKIRNRGVEMTLTGIPVLTKKFKWNFSFNLAVNNNKVLYIGDLHSIVIDGAYPRWGSEVSVSNVVGLPYGQIMGFGYKRDGKGNIIFSDGKTNPAPAGEPEQSGLMPLGSTAYKQTGGFTNEFHYGDLSLAFLIDFKYGARIYSGTNLLLYFYGLHQNTLQGRDGGYIGKGVLENGHPNTIVVPAQQYFMDISAGETDHIAQEFVYDASFVKLRSLSIGYNVPSAWLKKKFIKECKLSLVGRNLATLIKHTPNIDPESGINNTNGQGLELSGYPPVRSWGINLGMKF
jgi:TonB-linked SusC/RagA family outer membrane protein